MTYLTCPKCGNDLNVTCLTSHPPQYEAECDRECGFVLRFFQRKDRFAVPTQEEVNSFYGGQGKHISYKEAIEISNRISENADKERDKAAEIESLKGQYKDELPSSEKQTCSKCTYFTPTEEGIGECRRYPPIPIVHFYESTNAMLGQNSGWVAAKIVSTFPSVYAESLCGEYYVKE